MPVIKTMKTQSLEAGNAIVDWPADGVVNLLMPMDEDSGQLLDAPSFSTDVVERITGAVNTSGLFINATGGSNAALSFAANLDFPDVTPIGSASALFFHVGDSPAGGDAVSFGRAGATQYVQGTTQTGVRCKFADSGGTVLGPLDEFYTQSALDQIALCVLDRHNGLVTFREGTNAETVVTELAISTAGTFDWEGTISSSVSYNKTDGLVVLRYAQGLPVNYLDMVNEIATALRAGVDTLHPDPVREQWIYNIVGKYL